MHIILLSVPQRGSGHRVGVGRWQCRRHAQHRQRGQRPEHGGVGTPLLPAWEAEVDCAGYHCCTLWKHKYGPSSQLAVNLSVTNCENTMETCLLGFVWQVSIVSRLSGCSFRYSGCSFEPDTDATVSSSNEPHKLYVRNR